MRLKCNLSPSLPQLWECWSGTDSLPPSYTSCRSYAEAHHTWSRLMGNALHCCSHVQAFFRVVPASLLCTTTTCVNACWRLNNVACTWATWCCHALYPCSVSGLPATPADSLQRHHTACGHTRLPAETEDFGCVSGLPSVTAHCLQRQQIVCSHSGLLW
jgi:hypothetical protein